MKFKFTTIRSAAITAVTAVAALAAPSAMAATAPAPATATWQSVVPAGPVVGLDGKTHTAACSGYPGTDPTFKFWAKRGDPKKLVVYFEGGGACWDNLTCTFPLMSSLPAAVPQFFMPAIPANTDPANYDGIFSANSANPVGDWSFVYIPYCTGDLHVGSTSHQYYNAGHPVLPLGSTFTLQHKGFDNFMVVMDWIKQNLDAPQQLLVAGSSGGGYGATYNFPWLAKTYPDAKLSVLVDASQGISTRTFDRGNPGRATWNPQLPSWAFGTDSSSIAGVDMIRAAARAVPKARVGQFTTAYDSTQISFYSVMKSYYPPGGSCANVALDWHQQMVMGDMYASVSTPNYRHYVADGSYHTNLRGPQFYTESSAGGSYRNWVAALLAGTTQSNATWTNRACPTCMYVPPCQ